MRGEVGEEGEDAETLVVGWVWDVGSGVHAMGSTAYAEVGPPFWDRGLQGCYYMEEEDGRGLTSDRQRLKMPPPTRMPTRNAAGEGILLAIDKAVDAVGRGFCFSLKDMVTGEDRRSLSWRVAVEEVSVPGTFSLGPYPLPATSLDTDTRSL